MEQKENLKRFLNFGTLGAMVLVSFSLVYFGTKYYKESELVFLKNQYNIFLLFCLLILWIFGYLIYLSSQVKKLTQIILENKDLTQAIFDNQQTMQDDNNKLHRNTRQVFVQSLTVKDKGGTA